MDYTRRFRSMVLAAAAGAAIAPALRLSGGAAVGNWTLEPSADGTSLLLGFPKAFVMVIR